MPIWLTGAIVIFLVLGALHLRQGLARAQAPLGRYVTRGALMGLGIGTLVTGYAAWVEMTGGPQLSLLRTGAGLLLFVLLGIAATFPWRQQLKVLMKSAAR